MFDCYLRLLSFEHTTDSIVLAVFIKLSKTINMLTANTQDPSPVKELPTNHKDSIGFAIDNEPTKADYIFINNLLAAHLTDRTALNLLLQLENLIDIEVNYLFGELKTIFDFYEKSTRVAVLAPKAMEKEIPFEKLDTADIELKYFREGEQTAAEDWLKN